MACIHACCSHLREDVPPAVTPPSCTASSFPVYMVCVCSRFWLAAYNNRSLPAAALPGCRSTSKWMSGVTHNDSSWRTQRNQLFQPSSLPAGCKGQLCIVFVALLLQQSICCNQSHSRGRGPTPFHINVSAHQQQAIQQPHASTGQGSSTTPQQQSTSAALAFWLWCPAVPKCCA